MSLFGDGRSEERRRRVLTEEVISGAKSKSSSASENTTRSTRGSAHRYNDAAGQSKRTRLTDLVPKNYGLLSLWFFLGALLIAAFEALHFYAPQLPFQPVDGRIDAFQLGEEGSLATWFASFLLQAAAATSLVVYSIRKHRADDYHARYRIWIAAAVCWFVLAIDEAAGLHEGFQQLMIAVTGELGYGDGSVWWIGAYAIVLGVVDLKLLLDMKECRTSTALFVVTGLCFVAAVVVHLGVLPSISGINLTMLEEGLELAGNLFLLTSMAVHARYVILEATGEITPRVAKPRVERSTKSPSTAVATKKSFFGWFGKAKIDSPHGTPAPAGRSSDLEPATSGRVPSSAFRPTTETYDGGAAGKGGVKKAQAEFDEDDDGRRDNRKLSKSERKNLRRQKDFERRYGLSDD